MKLLTLIRHAKACPPSPSQPLDFLRPLSDRGLRDAALLGKHLKSAFNFAPDYLLVSPATRTRSTADLIAREADLPNSLIHLEPRLYEAPLSQFLEVLRALPDHVQHAACISHNPSTEALANWLCGHLAIPKLRTGGVVLLQLPLDSWSALQPGDALLLAHFFPSLIGGGRQAP